MYTLSEFRKNLRQAFNDADAGHEVVVERYGQLYQLVSLVSLPLGGNKFESIPGKEAKPIKELTPIPPTPKKPAETPPKPVIFKKSDGTTVVSGHDIESVTNTVKSVAPDVRFSNGVCKVHGLPLDSRGRCLQKGCKYA